MQMKRLPILIALLILTACTVVEAPTPTAAPSPTSTASVTPTATATATASVTPSITASPTATEIQSTPDFLALPISNDPLFAPGPDLDCQLPCWQGLRIGESTDEDIQRVLDETFGFNGTVDFFDTTAPLLPQNWILNALGVYTTGYIWQLPEEGTGFSLIFVIDETTRKLQGIRISYTPGNQYTVHTPQQIVKELDSPDYVLIDVKGSSESIFILKLSLIYKEGMSFLYITDIHLQEGAYEDYCLNMPSFLVVDDIVGPLSGLSRENATPVQKKWIFDYLDQVQPKPIDEVFGLTIEEFTEIALRDENPCIEINPDMLPDN